MVVVVVVLAHEQHCRPQVGLLGLRALEEFLPLQLQLLMFAETTLQEQCCIMFDTKT